MSENSEKNSFYKAARAWLNNGYSEPIKQRAVTIDTLKDEEIRR